MNACLLRGKIPGRCALLALALLTASARAEVKLASPFTSHMVLQREMRVPVWGTASADETVTVEFAGQRKSAKAAANGKWRLDLAALKTSAEPQTFTVTGTATAKPIALDDVLVGEVWLGSGQSNMVATVAKKGGPYGVINEAQEIAAANYPKIRIFTAADTKAYEPQAAVNGTWVVCSPETVPAFSAIGYMFSRDLQKDLNVPIGFLTVASGASCAEAWISREAMTADKSVKFMLDSLDECVAYFRATPQGPVASAPVRPTPINKPRAAVTRLTDPVRDQHFATVLFNGMVSPVIPYAIRGALWYQGESICWGTRGLDLYGHVLQTLVKDWRARWGEGDFPFYIVQLPGQENISNNPRIREGQAAVLDLPRTGMVVTIDVGEAKDVHPHNKAPVANRLARLALDDVYKKKVNARSPMLDSVKMKDGSAVVKFTRFTAPLAAQDGRALRGFQIAGVDKIFVDADAKIDGRTVVVSSPHVAKPVAVRYAWDNFPEGKGVNLVSGDLPAAPFRTDSWAYPIAGLVEH
mgnify:CR=1 FL=1